MAKSWQEVPEGKIWRRTQPGVVHWFGTMIAIRRNPKNKKLIQCEVSGRWEGEDPPSIFHNDFLKALKIFEKNPTVERIVVLNNK
jgi:hypothetical protein